MRSVLDRSVVAGVVLMLVVAVIGAMPSSTTAEPISQSKLQTLLVDAANTQATGYRAGVEVGVSDCTVTIDTSYNRQCPMSGALQMTHIVNLTEIQTNKPLLGESHAPGASNILWLFTHIASQQSEAASRAAEDARSAFGGGPEDPGRAMASSQAAKASMLASGLKSRTLLRTCQGTWISPFPGVFGLPIRSEKAGEVQDAVASYAGTHCR